MPGGGRVLVLVLACATFGGCEGCGPTFVSRTDSSADAGGDGTDAAPVPTDAGPPGPPMFSFVAWNVEQFPMTVATVDDVAGLIEDMGVDLVGMEEVADTAAFTDLVTRMPGWDGAYALEGDGFTRVGMLWNTARVQVSGLELLFSADSWAFPRPVLKGEVVVSEPGVSGAFDFTFLVVHLKAQPDDESEERRRLAVLALEQYVTSRLALGVEDDFVIAGDWNDELTDSPAENVFLPFLNDPAAYTFLTLPLEQSGSLPSYIPFGSFIDHILVTNGALDEYGPGGLTDVVPLDSTFPAYQTSVSDHRPVRATFAAPY